MFRLLILAAAFAGVWLLYNATRSYVARRLRYVDAVQKPGAPFIAGIVAAVVALPVVAILPVVGVGTAISAGIAVGLGVQAGAKGPRLGSEVLPP